MRSKLQKYGLCLLSCFMAFFMAESIYRIYLHAAKPLYRPSSFPHLGWEFNPGASKARAGYGYNINLSGFRDAQHTKEWEGWGEAEVKIVFIGDSITVGAGMDYEEALPALVESFFKRKRRQPAVKTVNLGLDATNTLQHEALLRYKAFPLRPDIVILGYFLNDTEVRFFEKLPALLQHVLRHYHFGFFLMQRMGAFFRNEEVRRTAGYWNAPAEDRSPGCDPYGEKLIHGYEGGEWPRTAEIIRSMSEECRKRSVAFGVVCFPLQSQLRGRCPRSPQEKIFEFCRRNQIPFLDLHAVFQKVDPDEKLYLERDGIHPSELGHRVSADALVDWLWSHPGFQRIFKKS